MDGEVALGVRMRDEWMGVGIQGKLIILFCNILNCNVSYMSSACTFI